MRALELDGERFVPELLAAADGGVLTPDAEVVKVMAAPDPDPRTTQRPEPRERFDAIARELLRRPFTPEAIRFKVQSSWGDAQDDTKGGAVIVGYIDARLVVERLNLVLPGRWEAPRFEGTNAGMWCFLEAGGVTMADVGMGRDLKAARSDAFKRAAVNFGIGVSVYAAPAGRMTVREHAIALAAQNEKPLIERKQKRRKKGSDWESYVAIELTQAGHAAARERYRQWLQETGIPSFGEPLDHGDTAESQGELADEQPVEEPSGEAPPQPLVTPEADALRGRIRALYEEKVAPVKGGKKELMPQRLAARVQEASISMQGLERLYGEVEELTKQLAAKEAGG